jgi:hypothetical protein
MSLVNNPYNQRDAQEIPPIGICSACETDLFEGDDVYVFDGVIVCGDITCLALVTGAERRTLVE